MTRNFKNTRSVFVITLMLSILYGAPASAAWKLIYVHFFDDGTVGELYEDDEEGLDYLVILDEDGNKLWETVNDSPGNPAPDDDTPGFTGTGKDVAESLDQLLNGKGGSLQTDPDFWETPIGLALIEKGIGHIPVHNPVPIDDIGDEVINQGMPWEGGGGGFDPLGGDIVEQMKKKGGSGGSDDDDDDGSSTPPPGSVPGGEELPGPPELVLPSPIDSVAIDTAMGVLPEAPGADNRVVSIQPETGAAAMVPFQRLPGMTPALPDVGRTTGPSAHTPTASTSAGPAAGRAVKNLSTQIR